MHEILRHGLHPHQEPLHITFSTKGRDPAIPEELEQDLHAYIGGICRRLRSPLLEIGGTTDHLHVLVSLSKTLALATLMLNIKRDTSRWLKPHKPAFAWQDGYFAFSIGESGTPALRNYIARQHQHHRKVGFKDEVRAFLRKYAMEWDERYIWD